MKKLVRIRQKESLFRRHQNHVISRRIVESAKRTGRGIALEKLLGIHERIRARGGEAFNRLSGWSFAQLGTFIAYKALLAGVPVVYVDPGIPLRPVQSVAIANAPTVRAKANSSASRADTPHMQIRTPPGISNSGLRV